MLSEPFHSLEGGLTDCYSQEHDWDRFWSFSEVETDGFAAVADSTIELRNEVSARASRTESLLFPKSLRLSESGSEVEAASIGTSRNLVLRVDR
mmetsp:Transcript_11007/g.14892  ORF Transcript_11007/g.14892 Transcript_11007/m.14892 type:complete len:94 (-) Transcript_11007:174-455(-)